MGSFITRCLFSNQVISDREPCVIFPIIEQAGCTKVKLTKTIVEKVDGEDKEKVIKHEFLPTFTNNIFHNAFWQPYGLHLTGVYADYGRFDIDVTAENFKNLGILFDALRENSFVAKTEYDSFDFGKLADEFLSDVTDKTPSKNIQEKFQELWKSLSEGFHDSLVYTTSFMTRDEPRQLQTAVISKSSYDSLLRIAKAQKPYPRRSWSYVLELLADPEKAVSEYLDKPGKPEKSEEERKRFFNFLVRDTLEKMLSIQDDYNPLYHADVWELAEGLVNGAVSPEDALTQIEYRHDEALVLRQLSDLGGKLLPHDYAGQDYSNFTGLKRASVTLRDLIDRDAVRRSDDFGDHPGALLEDVPDEEEEEERVLREILLDLKAALVRMEEYIDKEAAKSWFSS